MSYVTRQADDDLYDGLTQGQSRVQAAGANSFAAGWDFYHGTTGKGYVGVPGPSVGLAPGELILFGASGTPTSIWGGGVMGITVATNGHVGISTTAPQASLDVRGNVKLGNSGELFATGGEENLRIVRGVIDQDGDIIVGSGFRVFRFNGAYRIVFNTPFSAAPAVTATAHDTAGGGTVAMTRGVLGNFADIVLCGESNSAVCSPRNGTFHFIAIGPR